MLVPVTIDVRAEVHVIGGLEDFRARKTQSAARQFGHRQQSLVARTGGTTKHDNRFVRRPLPPPPRTVRFAGFLVALVELDRQHPLEIGGGQLTGTTSGMRKRPGHRSPGPMPLIQPLDLLRRCRPRLELRRNLAEQFVNDLAEPFEGVGGVVVATDDCAREFRYGARAAAAGHSSIDRYPDAENIFVERVFAYEWFPLADLTHPARLVLAAFEHALQQQRRVNPCGHAPKHHARRQLTDQGTMGIGKHAALLERLHATGLTGEDKVRVDTTFGEDEVVDHRFRRRLPRIALTGRGGPALCADETVEQPQHPVLR